MSQQANQRPEPQPEEESRRKPRRVEAPATRSTPLHGQIDALLTLLHTDD